jgi:Icc-related predicted phosphoesterase
MHLELEKTFPHLWSINRGWIMVVTDLHGDWEAYRRYRDRFLDLQANHRADCLIFTGDLIHPNSESEPDHSLEIVLDVLRLQQSLREAVIYLCGNHELPHIYSFGLSKGKQEFTPAFEAALSHSQKRAAVNKLFISLPFFVRTRAGVSITHAGAAPPMTNIQSAQALFHWDHTQQLDMAETELSRQDIDSMQRAYAKLSQAPSYDELARRYLAVTGQEDPRYNDLLRGMLATATPAYQQLHDVLFTKCEREYGHQIYGTLLAGMLRTLSTAYWPQQLLVAGHMTIAGGHQIVADRHLRLASGSHATPRESGQFLLFDAAQPVENIADLRACLHTVWTPT